MGRKVKYRSFLSIHEMMGVNKNGKTIKREVMTRSTKYITDDVVAGLLYDIDKQVYYLVSQFRVGTSDEYRYLTEVVAGSVDVGETPLDSFKREAMEEVGFECSIISEYGWLYTSPGGTKERVYLFKAYGRRSDIGGGVYSEDEDIELLEYTKEEILKLDIRDMKTKYLINTCIENN